MIWNASASAPVGLYLVRGIGKATVGELVAIDPPPALANFMEKRGYVTGDVLILKRVAALPPQVVCRRGHQITIDGEFVGMALERDQTGRQLPMWHGCHRVRDRAIFVMSDDYQLSFDGRYFGPLPLSSVVGEAVPLSVAD